jgi:serine/threonine protein phosphatase 1
MPLGEVAVPSGQAQLLNPGGDPAYPSHEVLVAHRTSIWPAAILRSGDSSHDCYAGVPTDLSTRLRGLNLGLMAIMAIGDIHGNLPALNDLLARITHEVGRDDTVVFLGDYIDRGPDSRGCIERILEFRCETSSRVVALLGNHEQWLLQTYRDHARHSWILGMEAFETIGSYSRQAAVRLAEEIEKLGARIVLEHVGLPYELFFNAMPSEHLDFLRNLSTFFRSPEAVFVHGGIDPAHTWPEEQVIDSLIWGTEDFPAAYRGDDRIVYGHADNAIVDGQGWPHPRISGRTYGLDTIGRGVLTALRLPDEIVFQSSRHL